jgi:serine/threonine protein kinase
VKLIFCLELTPDIVRNFAREAKKLAILSEHQHIVSLIGMCVRPPSLALALELCQYGSLNDVIMRHYHPPTIAQASQHSSAQQQRTLSKPHSAASSRFGSSECKEKEKPSASTEESNDKYIHLDLRTKYILSLPVLTVSLSLS